MLAFVYGTLTDPDSVDEVVDSFEFDGPAVLVGLRRLDGRYPTLSPPAGDGPQDAAAARTAGRLLRTPDAAALDEYEGVDAGLYVRASVPVAGRAERAAVYVGNPTRLGVAERVEWPGSGPFSKRVRQYLSDNEVAVRPE